MDHGLNGSCGSTAEHCPAIRGKNGKITTKNHVVSELITGKRYYAHSGRAAGAHDDIIVQYYNWVPKKRAWTKHIISTAPAGKGPGIGLQVRVRDLDGNDWKDVIVAGKSGTHIIWNDGKEGREGVFDRRQTESRAGI
jgi:hypothetical protein